MRDREQIQEHISRYGCVPAMSAEDWNGLTAYDAYGLMLAAPPCPGGPIINEPLWAEPTGPPAIESNTFDSGFTSSTPIVVNVEDEVPKETPVLGIDDSFNSDNGLFSVINTGLGLFQDVITGVPPIPGIPETIPWPTQAQGQLSTTTRGVGCWVPNPTRAQLARRKVKMVRLPDGSLTVMTYCKPRRMNVLNPRALGRAARRLGGFQKVASHIEKLINKAIKRKTHRSYRGAPKQHRVGCGCFACR